VGTGRGHLVRVQGIRRGSGKHETWSGLRLRMRRLAGQGTETEQIRGETSLESAWEVQFDQNGRSFEGEERRDDGETRRISGVFGEGREGDPGDESAPGGAEARLPPD